MQNIQKIPSNFKNVPTYKVNDQAKKYMKPLQINHIEKNPDNIKKIQVDRNEALQWAKDTKQKDIGDKIKKGISEKKDNCQYSIY